MRKFSREIEIIKASGLFDSDWYMSEYPDVRAVGVDPVEHYLRIGALLLRNPSQKFDTSYYIGANPDVAKSGLNPLVHFIQYGRKEERAAKALESSKLPIYEPTKKKVLSVCWVINRHDKMTHQYRVYNNAAALADYGVYSKIIYEFDLHDADLSGIDVLVLCRIAGTREVLSTVDSFRDSGRAVIFDIDDLVFDPDRMTFIRHVAERSDQERAAFYGLMKRLRDTLWHSDFATVSTYALKTEVERLGKVAFIVPNNISLNEEQRRGDLIARQKQRGTKHTRIGYFSGTKSHEHDFQECGDALFDIMSKRDDVELMIVGHLDSAKRFKPFGNRFIQLPAMSHEEMLKHLSTVHINLAPLEWRNPFTQCKSELKIFEAANYEIPTIASPTASYSAAIIHGRNGFLAGSPDEWRDLVNLLVDNKDERRRVGMEAYRSIACRFMSSNTAREAFAILQAAKSGCVRSLPQKSNPPAPAKGIAISVISILYKKAEEVTYFLESMRRQSFDQPYEIILVDDCSPDESVAIVEDFVMRRGGLSDSNPNMSVRIIRNQNNLGNCSCRNVGVESSSGEIVIVVDADCLFNRDFLSLHYQAHQRGLCDVVIGPKGIETEGRPPMTVLGIHDADPRLAVEQARPQDAVNQDSFVNCVTRNFSIRRTVIEAQLEGNLFDELFNYSASPDSGFGWEDVEMGYRLYKAGARIKFLSNTASIHVSHPPAVENPDKPYRSLKNFRRLHEKHPHLHIESRQWTQRTYKAIINWCGKVGGDLLENADHKFLEKHFSSYGNCPTIISNPKKLKVLTYRWHCPHQYELYKLGHDFTLVTGLGTGLCEKWEWQKRPIPENARMVRYTEVDPRDYDVAILHFDENVLRPELCLGRVPLDWGRTFSHAATEWDLPKIAICHGTPQFHGQYDAGYDKPDLGNTIEESRIELVSFLKNAFVVCNSHQACEEWRFEKSRTIWHGFSPHDFPPNMRGFGMFTMGEKALSNRPHYNGLFVMNKIREHCKNVESIAELNVPDPPVTYVPRTAEWAKAKYENYVRTLSRFAVYVNPTQRSPMPRTRGEAMMAGVVTVSLRNHDVDMFIKNGMNGFYADTAEEMAEQIRYLVAHPRACEKMSIESRLTSVNIFNQDRYLADWSNLLKEVVGGSILSATVSR